MTTQAGTQASHESSSCLFPLIVWFPSPLNLQKHNEGRPRDYQVYLAHF